MPFLSSLSRRDCQPELMDDPTLDPLEHKKALAGLARINRFSNSAGVLWPSLEKFYANNSSRPLRVLDIATGSGDVPIALAKRASQKGMQIEFAGCDFSPIAVENAKHQATQAGLKIEFFPLNVLEEPLPEGYDVLTSSLFFHHLSREHALLLLAKMAKVTQLVLINDLNRGRLNYLLVWLASHALTRSYVVHVDGPLSVRAAFTKAEFLKLSEEAGVQNGSIRSKFPARFLYEWRKA